jgi:membrane-associated phospholipid phosphatase
MRTSIRNCLNIIKSNDEAIARWISHVISPHIVGIVLTLIIALHYSDNPLIVALWLAGLIPLIVIPPLGYIFWLVNSGKLEDIYMPQREARLRPLSVLMLWLLLCLGLIRYWEAPPIVAAFLLAGMVLVGILSLITLFWKISFHGATITAAATTTVMVAGYYAWPVMLLVPLVGWARIRLKRHTLQQVIYGSLLGALIGLIMVYGLIQELL